MVAAVEERAAVVGKLMVVVVAEVVKLGGRGGAISGEMARVAVVMAARVMTC